MLIGQVFWYWYWVLGRFVTRMYLTPAHIGMTPNNGDATSRRAVMPSRPIDVTDSCIVTRTLLISEDVYDYCVCQWLSFH